MGFGTAPFSARTAGDGVFASMGVVGTLGTSDTGGTSQLLPFAVDQTTGAALVNVIAGNLGSITVSNVNPSSGTLNTLGTVGSITNIGSISNIGTMPAISANPSSGTQQTLGTVGTVLGLGGTIPVSGTVAVTGVTTGTYINISSGTQQTLGTVGTINGIGGTTLISGAYTQIAGSSVGTFGQYFLGSTDVSGYKSISFQLVGAFSATFVLQASNDGTTYTIVPVLNNAAGSTFWIGTISTPGIYTAPLEARYYQIYCPTFSSNASLTGNVLLSSLPFNIKTSFVMQQGVWTVTPGATITSAPPGAAYYLGIYGNDTTLGVINANGAANTVGSQTNSATLLGVGILGQDSGGTYHNIAVTTGGSIGTLLTSSTTGTQQTLGTVGVVNNIVTGTLATSGSTTGIGTVTNIGTINQLNPGTTSLSLGKSGSNQSYVSGDVGVLMMGQNNNNYQTITSANGQYSPIMTDQFGQVYTIGNIQGGTIQINPIPSQNILTTNASGTAAIGTLVAAPGVGTSIYITSYAIDGDSTTLGTAELILSFGTVISGSGVLFRATLNTLNDVAIMNYGAYPVNAGITNTPLTYLIKTGAGSISWNITYFIH